MGEKRWRSDADRTVMDVRDQRVQGSLTRRLMALAVDVIEPEDILDPDQVKLEPRGSTMMPDCGNCQDRCCIHKGRKMGILLSLRDVANLVDSGFEDLIIGGYTFRRKNGEILPDLDQMPRLAKKQGNCVFYDPEAGTCEGYSYRPTICRRYPFEVEYKPRSGKPFAQYIPDAPCAKTRGKRHRAAIDEMVREAVIDENVSMEDSVILADHHEELREIGFQKWLPPRDQCPPVEERDDEDDD